MSPALTTLSGQPLFPLIFGTMQFGGNASPLDSRAMFDAAREAGVTHFDTAHVYTNGASETILGELAQHNRDNIFVATKVGYTAGAGRDTILSQFDVSQSRLGLDTIDLLYMHRFDAATELEETFETLAHLQEAGRIRYIGVSNYAAWQVMKAQAVAQKLGTKIDALQPMYSLVKRQAEVELLPMCADQAVLPATYSPLGSGLLTGKYSHGGTGRLTEDRRYAARYGQGWMHEAAASFAELADDLGVPPAALAVAWVAQGPYGANPIISARNVDQLRPSLSANEVAMDETLYSQIAALTPTPAPATDRLEES